MPLVLAGATSGSTTIQATDAVTQTITLPAQTGTVMVNGPTFSATLSANQSVSSATYTKVTFNTEEWDTNNNFNTSTSIFTPTVAGYYQVNGSIDLGTSSITAGVVKIYKNGVAYKAGNASGGGSTLYTFNTPVVSALVYCNGSTDYVELYGYVSSTTPLFYSSAATYLQASLVRGA